jgi:transcriptional regulator with XRE-family HTH domain
VRSTTLALMPQQRTRRLELAELLSSWRARLRPEDVGLPVTRRRRVPGLSQEEVAELAGVSSKWYALFENGGNERRFSSAFVERVADALRLNERERAHLARLALPEIRLAVEQIERSAHDGALNNLAAIRSLVRRMSAVASLEEAAAAAVYAINDVLTPSCVAAAALVPRPHAPRIVGVGPRASGEFPVEIAADASLTVNYPNQFGHTTFSENRPPYRDTLHGAFQFEQRTSDGRSYFVAVTASGVGRGEHDAASEGALENASLRTDQYWTWNSTLEVRSSLSHGLFAQSTFRGTICAMWVEPRVMSPLEIELLGTVSAIVELGVTT